MLSYDFFKNKNTIPKIIAPIANGDHIFNTPSIIGGTIIPVNKLNVPELPARLSVQLF